MAGRRGEQVDGSGAAASMGGQALTRVDSSWTVASGGFGRSDPGEQLIFLEKGRGGGQGALKHMRRSGMSGGRTRGNS